MIEQSLQNRLRIEGIDRSVVTIITQMLVDKDDPAIANPTKFIGQFYTEEEARIFAEARDWKVKKDGSRGWRRVVPSPMPLRAINSPAIKRLLDDGAIIIAGGGGGIPVYIDDKGNFEGLDAVIDKDLGSAVLAKEINADVLCILTSVDKVSVNFGKPDQTDLDIVKLSELRKLHADGQFPAGSMGPKVKAAITFIENGGHLVTISSFENAHTALHGKGGTRIVPD